MSMPIERGTCTRQNTSTCDACDTCLRGRMEDSFIVNRERNEAVIVDVAEYAALKRRHSAGLISDLHKRAV